MKKLVLLLALLCLCLNGCSAKETTAPHAYEDLTIRIPTDYINLSDETFATALDFVFALDPIAINGMREEKTTFAAYNLDLDLQQYGQLLMYSNNVTGQLAKKDGISYFTYDSQDFTYIVTLWETEEAFWTVQAYCPTADYPDVKNEIWQILRSVTV